MTTAVKDISAPNQTKSNAACPQKEVFMKSFQVEVRPDEWKYIEEEIVTVEAKTAEQAAEKAVPIAAKGFRRQLASLAKQKGRICVGEVIVFDNAEGDDAEGQEFYYNI